VQHRLQHCPARTPSLLTRNMLKRGNMFSLPLPLAPSLAQPGALPPQCSGIPFPPVSRRDAPDPRMPQPRSAELEPQARPVGAPRHGLPVAGRKQTAGATRYNTTAARSILRAVGVHTMSTGPLAAQAHILTTTASGLVTSLPLEGHGHLFYQPPL
jgi:hypothetical protein